MGRYPGEDKGVETTAAQRFRSTGIIRAPGQKDDANDARHERKARHGFVYIYAE